MRMMRVEVAFPRNANAVERQTKLRIAATVGIRELESKGHVFQRTESQNEKIRVFFADKRVEFCGIVSR
jgi:hypothetical protein